MAHALRVEICADACSKPRHDKRVIEQRSAHPDCAGAGDEKFQGLPIALKGIYAIDMQANCVGVYWDEEADLRATQLDEMKAFLHSLAER